MILQVAFSLHKKGFFIYIYDLLVAISVENANMEGSLTGLPSDVCDVDILNEQTLFINCLWKVKLTDWK